MKNKKAKYTGGSHIEVFGNPDTAMKKLQRWLKESNFFMEIREREGFTKPSEEKRKAKHRAKSRERKRWDNLEQSDGPVKTKRIRSKSNRGKKTSRRDVKKPNA